jgi:hypothetical protein
MRIRTFGMTLAVWMALGLAVGAVSAAAPTFEPAPAREDATLAPLKLQPEGGKPSTGHAKIEEDPAVPPAPPENPPGPAEEPPPSEPPPSEPPPSEPPTPPTTPPAEAETGPVTIFGPKNLLAQRYRSHFPPVVHVQNPEGEGDGKWTAYVSDGQIKMVKGLHGKAFVTYTVTQADIDTAASLGGSLTAENKLKLVKHFRGVSEKPFEAVTGIWLKQPKLLPFENRLLKISQLGKKMRWLYNKVETAPNEAVKIFWGAQIKIISLYVNHLVDKALNELWEEVDGELDRGQVAIVPGRTFDLTLNVAGVHVMYRDDDLTAFGPLLGRIKKRLTAEMLSIGDQPPAQQELRKQAIQKRLDLISEMIDLTDQG